MGLDFFGNAIICLLLGQKTEQHCSMLLEKHFTRKELCPYVAKRCSSKYTWTWC